MVTRPKNRTTRGSGAEEPAAARRPFIVSSENTAESASGDIAEDKIVAGTAGGFMLKPRPFTVTMPPPDDYYLVSEKQIDELSETSKDHSLEIALAAGGAGIGLLQNLFAFARQVYEQKPIAFFDAMLALAAIALLVLAVTKYLQFRGQGRSKISLKEQIKSGQKATVANE